MGQSVLVPLLIVAGVAAYVVQQKKSEAAIARLSAEVTRFSSAEEHARAAEDLRRRLPGLPVPVEAPAVPEERAAKASEPATPTETAPPPPLEPPVLRERMDQCFTQERPDPSWAAQAKQQVEASLAAVLPSSSAIRSVECRTTMCRIESTHGDREQYQRFIQDGLMNPDKQAWNGAFLALRFGEPTDGPMLAVVYVAREGEELPTAEIAR